MTDTDTGIDLATLSTLQTLLHTARELEHNPSELPRDHARRLV